MVGIERESKFDPDTDGKENTQEVFDKISIFDTRKLSLNICTRNTGVPADRGHNTLDTIQHKACRGDALHTGPSDTLFEFCEGFAARWRR